MMTVSRFVKLFSYPAIAVALMSAAQVPAALAQDAHSHTQAFKIPNSLRTKRAGREPF